MAVTVPSMRAWRRALGGLLLTSTMAALAACGATATPTGFATLEPAVPGVLVVTFGDSFADLGGWPRVLADMVAADRGAAAAVSGFSCQGGCGGSEVDRFDSQAGIAEDLAVADLIIVQPQPGLSAMPVWRAYSRGVCGNRTIADHIYALGYRGTLEDCEPA